MGGMLLSLSEDRKMGKDFVISCVEAGGVPRVEHSWNYGKSNQMIVDMEGTRLVEGSIKDSEDLYCKIERNNWVILLWLDQDSSSMNWTRENTISSYLEDPTASP